MSTGPVIFQVTQFTKPACKEDAQWVWDLIKNEQDIGHSAVVQTLNQNAFDAYCDVYGHPCLYTLYLTIDSNNRCFLTVAHGNGFGDTWTEQTTYYPITEDGQLDTIVEEYLNL